MNLHVNDTPCADTEFLHCSQGLAYCDGDVHQYMTLLGMFLETAEKRIQELHSFRDADNLDDYAIKVHALKSIARGFGADLLADCAYEHEMKSKAHDSDFVAKSWDSLVDVWNKTLVDIRYCVNESEIATASHSNKPDTVQLAPEEQSRVMSEIKEDVANFNFADAAKRIDMLLTHIQPAATKEMLEQLSRSVKTFDYIASATMLGIE